MRQLIFAAVLACLATLGLRAQAPRPVPPAGSKAPQYGYTVVRSYPHDPKAYTQGLEYFDGFLYEGTGVKGSSAVRQGRARKRQGGSGSQAAPAIFRRRHHYRAGQSLSAYMAGSHRICLRREDAEVHPKLQLFRRRLGADARTRRARHERRHQHAPVSRVDAISGAPRASR